MSLQSTLGNLLSGLAGQANQMGSLKEENSELNVLETDELGRDFSRIFEEASKIEVKQEGNSVLIDSDTELEELDVLVESVKDFENVEKFENNGKEIHFNDSNKPLMNESVALAPAFSRNSGDVIPVTADNVVGEVKSESMDTSGLTLDSSDNRRVNKPFSDSPRGKALSAELLEPVLKNESKLISFEGEGRSALGKEPEKTDLNNTDINKGNVENPASTRQNGKDRNPLVQENQYINHEQSEIDLSQNSQIEKKPQEQGSLKSVVRNNPVKNAPLTNELTNNLTTKSTNPLTNELNSLPSLLKQVKQEATEFNPSSAFTSALKSEPLVETVNNVASHRELNLNALKELEMREVKGSNPVDNTLLPTLKNTPDLMTSLQSQASETVSRVLEKAPDRALPALTEVLNKLQTPPASLVSFGSLNEEPKEPLLTLNSKQPLDEINLKTKPVDTINNYGQDSQDLTLKPTSVSIPSDVESKNTPLVASQHSAEATPVSEAFSLDSESPMSIKPTEITTSLAPKPISALPSIEASSSTKGAEGITGQVLQEATLAIKNGQKEMTLQLTPDDLGTVRIKLNSGADQVVSARLIASTAEAHEVLTRQAETLQKALETQGVRVGKIQVVLAGEAMSHQNTGSQSDSSQNSSQQQAFHEMAQQQYREGSGQAGLMNQGQPQQNSASGLTSDSNPELLEEETEQNLDNTKSNGRGTQHDNGRVSLLV